MPKKANTLLNYFSSPKGASPKAKEPVTPKSAARTARAKTETPKSSKRVEENGASSPAGRKRPASSRANSETPKQKKKVEKKVKVKDEEKKSKGKENVRNNKERKKRPVNLADGDSEDEEVNSEQEESPQPKKRRRIIVPDVEGEDSEDDYKPSSDDDAESESGASEAVSESEPETENDSDDEPAPKSRGGGGGGGKKRGGGGARGKASKETLSTTHAESTSTAKASTTQAWPHLKYEFLQPDNIKDKNKRRPDDPEYNSRTLYVPKDFLDNQTPAMRQWWVLKCDHFDSILCFKVGKFYELYHMDAVVGANELNISFMKGDFAHSGFPEMAWGRFSQNLIERGYKIARVEQTENPEMAQARYSKLSKVTKFDKVVNREVCQISTRGARVYNAQDYDVANPSSTFLLSVYEKSVSKKNVSAYGVCFIDTTIGDFHLGQFEDDRCNSRLLTLLAHYPPAHVIYERNNLSQTTLKILNSYLPAALKDALNKESQFWSAPKVLKNLHDGDYFQKDDSEFSWPEGLKPFLNKADTLGLTPADDKELAVNALGGCVYILKEFLLEQQLLGQGRFKTYVPPDFSDVPEKKKKTTFAHNMVLDAITINNLRILGNEGSLIRILDQCCTAFGKRLIREWICRPSCRKSVIIERQKAITQLLDNPDVAREARSKLNNLPDIERLLSRIHAQGNAAKLKNHPDSRAIMFDAQTYSRKTVSDFILTLNGFEEMLNIIELFSDIKDPLIGKCTKIEPAGDFPDLKDTLLHFKNAFNHEEAKKEGFIVPKKGVDSDYDQILEELAEIKKDADDYLKQQGKQFAVTVKYVGTDRKRYQLEIPERAAGQVSNDYELQGQRKGFKRYYTSETREFLTRQTAAEEQRDKILKDSNRRIFAKFSDHYDDWSNAAYNIAVLDCLLSLAEYARTCETCVPEIYDDTDDQILIEIRDGKHPCITSDNFIPNDTVIATEDSAPLMILTGPNMGGKSTLMRQVGLITVMAQIGCHVPASACRVALVDRIFTRLGANDDIMAGQSTFLVELSETAAILQHATQYSLVLLDELGRGTSTYDGTAIAASVVEALTKMKCRTLFSTHYHSLVEDYKTNKNVTLAHMACMVENDDEEEVSEENVTFLYKLSEGACPKSYGFNAARLAGIPAHVTKRALEIATKLETEVNLRHAFTTLCRVEDKSSIKPLFDKTMSLLAKVEI